LLEDCRRGLLLFVGRVTKEPLLTLLPDPLPRGCPTRAELRAGLTAYSAAMHKAMDGSRSAIKDRIMKRDRLARMLKDIAPYLERTARAANDLTILIRSGFDLQRPNTRTPSTGIPPAPIITIQDGPISGSVIIHVKPLLRGVGSYQAEDAVGDSNFTGTITLLTGSRIMLTGLAIAQWHHFRVRGIGTQGPGDWSDPIRRIVI